MSWKLMRFERELADPEAARRIAVTTLVDVAKKWKPNGRDQTASMEVRDKAGLMCRVTITLQGEWLQ